MIGREFAEAIAGKVECVVETSAEVFERHRGGELYELLGIEVTAQLGEELVGNLNRSLGNLLGVLEARFFDFREVRTGRKIG
jgi:hypothetical protein